MVDPALRTGSPTGSQDRLDLVIEHWDPLDMKPIEASDAEKQILDERLADLQRHPDDEQPWDEFMDGLRARL